MFRRVAKFIIRCMDAVASIPYNAMPVEDWDPKEASALAYGMSLMVGSVVIVTAIVIAIVILALVISTLVALVIEHPIVFICIILFFSAFILAGHLRHRFGGKQR